MPSSFTSTLNDIAENIVLATRWTTDHTEESFKEDRKTFYAVTRCLMIISEAVRRLPSTTLDHHPQILWHQIKAAGNLYRHQYEDVLEKDVWDTVHNHLPALSDFAAQELRSRP